MRYGGSREQIQQHLNRKGIYMLTTPDQMNDNQTADFLRTPTAHQRAKRITMATIKAFIRKNDNLFIKVKSKFDGMTDCVETVNMGFAKVMTKNLHPQNHYEQRTLGIAGAWFVGSSRDYFEVYQDERFTGFKIFNCCGSFLLVTEKTV